MTNLNPKAFGLSCGIIWGLVLFVLTILAVSTGYSYDFLELLSKVYIGYKITYLGSLIGLVYGFLDGFIGAYIFVWLYNKFNK